MIVLSIGKVTPESSMLTLRDQAQPAGHQGRSCLSDC